MGCAVDGRLEWNGDPCCEPEGGLRVGVQHVALDHNRRSSKTQTFLSGERLISTCKCVLLGDQLTSLQQQQSVGTAVPRSLGVAPLCSRHSVGYPGCLLELGVQGESYGICGPHAKPVKFQ